MYRFLFLAFFVVMGGSHLTMGLGRFPLGTFPSPRSFDFREICKWLCPSSSNHHHDDYDNYDYFSRSMDQMKEPRIFCGLCEKKYNTTNNSNKTHADPRPSVPTTNLPPSTPVTKLPPSSQATNPPPSSQATNPPPSSQATTAPPSSQATTAPTSSQATTAPPSSQATTAPPSSQATTPSASSETTTASPTQASSTTTVMP